MRIKTKLYTTAAISVVLVGTLALLSFQSSAEVTDDLKKVEFATELVKATTELSLVTEEYLTYHYPRMEEQWISKFDSTMELIEEEEASRLLDEIRTDLASLNNSFSQLKSTYEQREELIKENASQDEVERTIIFEERLAGKMRLDSTRILANALGIAAKSRQEATATQQRASSLVSIFAAVLVLIIGTSTFLIAKSVSQPIAELVRGASIIGRGDLEYRIDIKSRDETGYLSRAFNEMVAQLKQQRDHLLESEERFRQFFENEPEYCYMISPEGIILDVNEAALKVLGYEKEQLVGKPLQTIYAPESLPKMKQLLAKWENTGALRDEEMNILTKEGDRRIVLLSAGVVRDKDGKLLRSVSVQRDITERVRAEEELRKHREHLEELVEERTSELEEKTVELEQANVRLREADRLKSIFLASMSHELRTPLNSIIGFTGIILMGMVGEISEEQRKQLTMAKNSAHHLLSLINDLLDISKIEAGKVELSLEGFRLDDVMREVVETFSPAISEKGLELLTEVPAGVTLFSDRRRMKQVLMNLVSNAIKFTDQGSVKIAARIFDETLEMRVIDTGVGIKREDMNRLFEPFQQVDTSSMTKKYEGTGLGLYLCKKLVTLLGGDISAKSEYGGGSEFTFTLPLKYEEGK